MTMWNNQAFTESELSLFGRIAVMVLLVIPVVFITSKNIALLVKSQIHMLSPFVLRCSFDF